MSRGRDYTTTELNQIKSLLNEGKSLQEIAEITNRPIMGLRNLVWRMEWTNGRYKEGLEATEESWDNVLKKVDTTEEPVKVIVPVKEKTLDDFTPREIIKNMYKRGYRIMDGQLVCMVPQVVKIKDIINE